MRQTRYEANAAVTQAVRPLRARLGCMTAKPFIVALVLGAAAALFVYRDKAAGWFPKGEHIPDWVGTWKVQALITLLVVIGLAYMLSG
jgi:hypothetical protein